MIRLFDVRVGKHEVADDADQLMVRTDKRAQGAHGRTERVKFFHSHAVGIIRTVEIGEFGVQRIDNFLRNRIKKSLFDLDIPTSVFHNLIDTFKKNLPVWQRYFEIRRKVLGLKKFSSDKPTITSW